MWSYKCFFYNKIDVISKNIIFRLRDIKNMSVIDTYMHSLLRVQSRFVSQRNSILVQKHFEALYLREQYIVRMIS